MNTAKIVLTGSSITINDQEVTLPVTEATLVLASGDVPRLHLSVVGGPVEFAGEGIVHVLTDADVDVKGAMCELLDGIDPATLEERALEGADLATSVGDGFIRALKEMLT